MGLSELITALEADADVELRRRRDAVAAEVERIRAAADAEASAVLSRAVSEARTTAGTQAERAVTAARTRSAAGLRRAREEGLDAVLVRVSAELDELRARADYPTTLAALLDEALAVLPEARAVHVDPRDAGLVRDLLARVDRPLQLVPDLRSAGGVAVAERGRRVDNTVESRLAAAWPTLRSALAAQWTAELESAGGHHDRH